MYISTKTKNNDLIAEAPVIRHGTQGLLFIALHIAEVPVARPLIKK
nr:hypothetical protein [uncultured Blautia sp.]